MLYGVIVLRTAVVDVGRAIDARCAIYRAGRQFNVFLLVFSRNARLSQLGS